MSETTKLQTEIRTEFGKGYARRARVNGQIPAVLYGHGAEPVHVLLPARETTLALRQANALLELDIDGKSQLALAKDVQRDALKGSVDHVDLLIVKKGEKVTVDVNVHVEGEVASGAELTQELFTVSVEAEATHLPESVTLNVEGKEIGDVLHASDLVLPKGTVLLTDAEAPVATVHAPAVAESADDAAEGEEAEAAAEAAE